MVSAYDKYYLSDEQKLPNLDFREEEMNTFILNIFCHIKTPNSSG